MEANQSNFYWDRCMLCQKKNANKLSDPRKNVRTGNATEGYRVLAARMHKFYGEGQLPFVLPAHFLPPEVDVEGLVAIMDQENALWHRECYLKIGPCMTKRLCFKPEKPKVQSPVKTRSTKLYDGKKECIFRDIHCGDKGTLGLSDDVLGPLFRVGTFKCDAKIRQWAESLNDTKLISRFAACEGYDLMAQDALYHNVCYLELGKRVKAKEALKTKEDEDMKIRAHWAALSKMTLKMYDEKMKNFQGAAPICYSSSQIQEMYQKLMAEAGYPLCDVHSTRLRRDLLAGCSLLHQSVNRGRNGAVVMFKDDANIAMRSFQERGADLKRATYMAAADYLRKAIFDQRKNNTTPGHAKEITHFIEMVLDGPQNIRSEPINQVVSTIADLLSFHAAKRPGYVRPAASASSSGATKRAHDGQADQEAPPIKRRRRHDSTGDTDAPVYLGLKMFVECKKKGLIQIGSKLGVNISYARVSSIVRDAANTVAETYHSEGVVVPPSFRHGVFTTGAVDNFDHNPSSNTAQSAFHGTVISLVQHPDQHNPGIPRDTGRNNGSNARRRPTLPTSYTNVQPCFLNPKSAKNTKSAVGQLLEPTQSPLELLRAWLDKVHGENYISCAAHHAQRDRGPKTPANIEVLPIFREPAHTIEMMFHAMTVVSNGTRHVNPNQTPVMVADQPLFALCKQIQYLCPQHFGAEKFFVMFGGLHLEMNILKLIGEWLAGSGWNSVLVQAGVTTKGRSESLTTASHVKRSRYAHEVTAAVLSSLQRDAYEKYADTALADRVMDFNEWREERRGNSPHFRFWDVTLVLELSLLLFVCAIRAANFSLYKETLRGIAPWFFALDHGHYARWATVHLHDLESLRPDLEAAFNAGKFVVQKTFRSFSNIALDHAHEQLNAVLKGDGGIVGILSNDECYRKWLMAAPEIARMIKEYEAKMFAQENETREHNSENNAAQLLFETDCKNLKTIFQELGNPYQEESDELYNVNTKEVAADSVVATTMKIELKGKEQYRSFVENRLADGASMDISEPIPRNNLPLFSTKATRVNKSVVQVKNLKAECNLITRYVFACQNRKGNVDELFSFEFHDWPPALAVDEKTMRPSTKSDLIGSLSKRINPETINWHTPTVDAKILDGAAVVHILKAGVDTKTFGDYANNIFLPFVQKESASVCRVDIVFDRYFPGSLKTGTREKRGDGNRVQVAPGTPIPNGWSGWSNVLKNSTNKKELFCLLATTVVEANTWDGKEIYATRRSTVLTNCDREDLTSIAPCNHEEADGRLMLHVADAASRGCSRVLVRTVDTDVLVLAISCVFQIEGLEELWVSMGAGKHHKYIPAHEVAEACGPMMSAALPSFHAFTGCDTTSAFFRRGKVSAMSAWNAFPDATVAFLSLGNGRVDEETMELLEKFTSILYDQNTDTYATNTTRRRLAGQKGRLQDFLPPTLDALTQHALRASLQAQCWVECLQATQEERDPLNWGWKMCGDQYLPVWKTKPSAEKGFADASANMLSRDMLSCPETSQNFSKKTGDVHDSYATVQDFNVISPMDVEGDLLGMQQCSIKLSAESSVLKLSPSSPPISSQPNMKIVPISQGPPLEWMHFLTCVASRTPEISDDDDDNYIFHPSIRTAEDDAMHSENNQDPPTLQATNHEQGKESSLLKLFANSNLSVHDSVIAILSYASSCHLSGTDFCKLLDLIHLLLPKPNNLPLSKHSVFSIFENDSRALNVTYYCNTCWKTRASLNDKCDVCKDSIVKYFLNCSIVSQLQKLYARPGFVEKLQYKYNRTKENPDNIEDVYDSTLYKEAEQSILANSLNVSLTWYTDGMCPYNCSSYSLWVFQFVINELSPEERYKEENLIIGGLWGDSEKPHPNVFLLPMYNEVVKMKDGFPVKLYGEDAETQVKAILLFGACDVPAKAGFMNMKGHAGYNSCPKCFIAGEKSARTGQVMVFPHEEHLVLRTEENYKECVMNAVRLKTEDRGVCGPTILSYMMYCGLIRSTSIDSMHCTFLGIMKQFLKLWFNSKFSGEPFSLVNFIEKVNNLLQKLKLPHFVQRLPEDVTKLHFWKASLCRNFLLYISLVIMKLVMKPEYYENFSLFVNGIAILHKSSISMSDLNLADQYLNKFSERFEKLYGVRHMSSNIHLLRHLAASVSECGNLCITNCFKFEDLNGKLLSLAHGNTHAVKQIVKNLFVLSELPLLISSIQCTDVKSYCLKVTNHKYLMFSEKIAEHVYVVGNTDSVTQHCSKISEMFSTIFPSQMQFRTFSRVSKYGKLFVSASYTKGSRVSSYCKYVSSIGAVHGKILTFVKTCSAIPQYLAYILRSDNVPVNFDRHVIFSSAHETTDLVPISNLICVSFCLKVDDTIYLVDPLNPFEME